MQVRIIKSDYTSNAIYDDCKVISNSQSLKDIRVRIWMFFHTFIYII